MSLSPDPIYLATAIEAALAAGRVQRRWFRQPLKIDKKGPIDLVTAVDLEVEREFRRLIETRFPSHAVLGEEQGSGAVRPGDPDAAPARGTAPPPSRFRWIIDPLDGTTNFAHGLALFCCSIALEIDGRVAVGAVYDPMAEELFTAERGVGAWLNGVPLGVSSCDTLGDGLLCTGFPYTVHERRQRLVDVFAAFLGVAQGVRRLGSAALDLCYVAAGRLDGFWEVRLHPWDMAAGALIVEEAGGRVTDYRGGPVDMLRGQIVASNGRIHEAMVETILRAEAGNEPAR